ncbi:MAG: histidine phosphatase family protein [Gemmatimonadales bacterium]
MLLLLVRHALAADRSLTEYPDDALRPLVGRGRKVQRRISRRLAKLGYVPSAVLSSPWKRAWQTAGILAREVGLEKTIRESTAALAQEPNLEALAAAIGPRGDDEVVALVGHEPWMGELASVLLTGSPTRLSIRFPKSAVMGIRATGVGPAGGQLAFFLTPRAS